MFQLCGPHQANNTSIFWIQDFLFTIIALQVIDFCQEQTSASEILQSSLVAISSK